MDPVQASQSNQQRKGLALLLQSKGLVILAGIVVLLAVVSLFVFMGSSKKKTSQPVDENPTSSSVPRLSPISQPTVPPEKEAAMRAAIDEAKKSAQEYDNWQSETVNSYPWLRKLPLAKDKYYVYFDVGKKAFVGRLYPTAGDNVEQMKTLAIQELKLKQIPADSYPFEWQTFPR